MSDHEPELFGDFPRRYLDDWERLAEPTLKGKKLSTLVDKGPDGVTVEPLQTRQSWPTHKDPAGLPGFFPYIRGGTADGTHRGWDVRQSYADPDVDRLVAALRQDLAAGVTSVALDLPSLDVATATKILDAVPVTTKIVLERLDVFESATVLVAASEANDRPLTANLGLDPLAALLANGALVVDVDSAFHLMTDVAHHVKGRTGCATVLVRGDVYDDGGATDAQQLAYAMGTGLTYLRVLLAAGFSLEDANRQITFRFAVGPDVLRSVSKLRAARWIWSRIMGACGARDDARRTTIEAVTSRRAMSRHDVWVNTLRATTASFAAIAGGANAVVVRSHVDPIGLPDDTARRIAKNVQLILRDEAHVGHVVDPAGGAWAFEKLTESLARAAWSRLQEVESKGGMERAVETGFVTRCVEEAYRDRADAIAKRNVMVTGVSDYPWLDEPAPATWPSTAVPASPRAVELPLLREKGRTVATAIVAARDGASTADLFAALERHDTRAKTTPLSPRRDAAPFEALRAKEAQPVLLLSFGTTAQHTPRTTFAKNFFAAGGLTPVDHHVEDADAVAAAVEAAGAKIAVLCSSDDVYETHAEDMARAAKRAGIGFVYLAGRAGPNADRQRRAGIDAYVHLGVDAVTILTGAHELAKGVTP